MLLTLSLHCQFFFAIVNYLMANPALPQAEQRNYEVQTIKIKCSRDNYREGIKATMWE